MNYSNIIVAMLGWSLGIFVSWQSCLAQTKPTDPEARVQKVNVVKVNLMTGLFESELPFDEPFNITGTINSKVSRIVLEVGKCNCGEKCTPEKEKPEWPRRPTAIGTIDAFNLPMFDTLLPNKDYCFHFKIYQDPKASKPKDEVRITGRAKASLTNHFDTDLGLLYAFKPKHVSLVTTTHLHFAPFSKGENLAAEGKITFRSFRKRMSIFAGVAPLSVHSGGEDKAKIENLLSIGNFVYGFGVRSLFYWPGFLEGSLGRKILQPMRINVGVMRFAQIDENPLISKKKTKSAFFVSLTYDVDIGGLLGKPILGLFGN